MSSFSRELIDRSGYLGEGFADVYDAFRPAPPDALLDVLLHAAAIERPRLVVDLGAGTGLSTRAWAARADEVVGVEPNPQMAERARASTSAPNVRYVEAFAAETGLDDGTADLVTCSQAFHWMEPQPVLAEAARILRTGGMFAAYDYDVPFAIEPEVDEAFATHFQARGAARERLALHAGGSTWPKHEHLRQIHDRGLFRYARELVCHGWDEADAERVIGFARSIGGPIELFGDQAPEVGETYETLAATARRVLGDSSRPMLVCYRIRLGIV